MSVQFSPEELIEKNQTALDASSQCIERLEKLGEEGLFADDETDRLIQLSHATNERTQLRDVNAHLKAAEITVRRMDDETANELNDLGNRLAEKISDNLIINATIDSITSVLDDVSKLQGIIGGHTDINDQERKLLSQKLTYGR